MNVFAAALVSFLSTNPDRPLVDGRGFLLRQLL